MVRDRMHDLPRKIQEFFCINCGERFWQEHSPTSIDMPPAAPSEVRSAQVVAGVDYSWILSKAQN
jgi:hypothetical protein